MLECSHPSGARLAGCLSSFTRLDLPFETTRQYAATRFTLEGGYRGMEQLLHHCPELTAVFAYSDIMAIGAVRALRENGLAVPTDLSIISFNDTALSALTDPPLTSVSTHVEVMSETAVGMLAQRAVAGGKPLPLKIVVPPTVIRRESVCPPKTE